MAWTPEKVKLLKKLWSKGKSTVEIGRELGISKNAVVGKVHRLELAARPSPIKKNETQKKEIQQPKPDHMTLMDLKLNSCRWPIGDPQDPDFHFCGENTVTGKPYCPNHCKIAYTSIKELSLQNSKTNKEKKDDSDVTENLQEDSKTKTAQKKKEGK